MKSALKSQTPCNFGLVEIHNQADILRIALTVVFGLLISGCASYPGDRFLRLTDSRPTWHESKTIAKAQDGITRLLDHLNIPTDRRSAFETISPKHVIRKDGHSDLSHVRETLVLAKGNIDISFAENSIIVATGITHISHSSNNVVVVADNLDVSFDGSTGKGSILIAKGRITISGARKSFVSSAKGLYISHGNDVLAYNTIPGGPRGGVKIEHRIVRPLFVREPAPTAVEAGPTVESGAEDRFARDVAELIEQLASSDTDKSADAQRQLTSIAKTVGNQLEGASKSSNPQVAYRSQEVLDEFRKPKWPDAEVHMVCLYTSGGRKAIVEVRKTKKPVILLVCGYNKIRWDIRTGGNAEILQVIASGYLRQIVQGTVAPITTYSYEEKSQFYFSYSDKMPNDSNIVARVRQLTGRAISSYQGRFLYGNTPFFIGVEG